jgi:hypothetical protein
MDVTSCDTKTSTVHQQTEAAAEQQSPDRSQAGFTDMRSK